MKPAPSVTSLSMLTCTVPVFPHSHRTPVQAAGWDHIPASAMRDVAARLGANGYAHIQVGQAPGPGTAGQLAARLGLGPAFIPPQYRSGPHVDGQGVTRITADTATTAHPAFGQATGQKLHSDGTLQRIGEIKTTIMVCARPAASGGISQLFNAAGAFAALLGHDPAAAAALTAPEVLVRTSNLPGSQGQSVTGPAFAIADGRVISRYSVTSTDTYNPGAVSDPAALNRALAFFQDAGRPGSGFYAEITLTGGQVLLLANDMISHGRTPYHDDPAAPRLLYRALFTTRCTVTEQAA